MAQERGTPADRHQVWLVILLAGLLAILAIMTVVKPAVAATSTSFQAEKMQGAGKNFFDKKASKDRGRVFYKNSRASRVFKGSTDSLLIRARGDLCKGAPRMVVKIDGRRVMSRLIRAKEWNYYSTDINVPSGEHEITTKFTNDRKTRECDRNLRTDKIKFHRTSSSTPSDTQRMVFAHYMLGAPAVANFNNGTQAEFEREIRLAQSAGFDGWALNVGNAWEDTTGDNPRFKYNAKKIFDAADALNTDFKLFFSADSGGGGPIRASVPRDMIRTYGNHPNYYRVNGKAFLGTFSGQDHTFGYSTPQKGWQSAVLDVLERDGHPVYFVPSFFYTNGGGHYPSDAYLDNFYNAWAGVVNGFHAWTPWANAANRSDQMQDAVSLNARHWNMAQSKNKTYMAQVHPTFSVHKTATNNRIMGEEAGGQGMQRLWQGIIAKQPPLVEFLTWNDWLESTYVAPVGGPSPTAQGVTKSHSGYLELNEYYIKWYKTGSKPEIAKDKLFYFYRTHSKDAVATQDPLGKPQAWDSVEDRIYVTAMLREPATVTVSSGTTTERFSLPAGISNISIPFRQGEQSVATLRNGTTIMKSTGEVPIRNSISKYDFNSYSNFVEAS